MLAKEQGNPLRIGGDPIAATLSDAGPAPKKKEAKASDDKSSDKDDKKADKKKK